MMKGRYIGLALAVWLVLIVGYGLLSQHGQKTASPGSPTTPVTTGTSTSTSGGVTTTTPSSYLPVVPDNSVVGGGNGPVPYGQPPAGQNVRPLPPQIVQQTEQQNVSASGWPAVAFLPYKGRTIRIVYKVFDGHQPLLSVTYTKTRAEALKELRRFLGSHGDRLGHYRVDYVSPAVKSQRQAQAKQVNLAFNGYPVIVRLPDHYRRTTLTFAGKHGGKVWIRYTGLKAAAEKRLDYWLKIYADHRSHYELVK